MIKKIVFSAAIVLISLFLCSAGCGNVAVSSPAPSIVINFSDDFFGWGDSSGGSQQDNSGGGTLNSNLKYIEVENNGMDIPQYDESNIYIFIHVTGNSISGNFINTAYNLSGNIDTSHPRGVEFQTTEGNRPEYYARFAGQEESTFDGVTKPATPGYTSQYGFSSADGKTLDIKLYIGSTKFSVREINPNFVMRNIVVADPSKTSGWGDAKVTLVRKSDVRFNIPMSKFDSGKHKNWAFFTVKFDQNPNYTSMADPIVTVTFDGFAPKN